MAMASDIHLGHGCKISLWTVKKKIHASVNEKEVLNLLTKLIYRQRKQSISVDDRIIVINKDK